MANEEEKVVDNDEIDIEEVVDEDTTDWKARSQKLEEKAIAQRARTKELKAQLSKFQEAVLPKEEKKVEKTSFGYDELAWLEVKGVHEEDHNILLEAINATGKDLRTVLGSKWMQADIAEAKEVRATKNAMPKETKRSGGTATDDIGYHYQKYEASGFKELPTDPVLKNKVIRELMKRETEPFSFG